MAKKSVSSCAKKSVSECLQHPASCYTYKRKGKEHCRHRPATKSKRGEVIGTVLLKNGREVQRYRGPKGGEYYISKGRKIYG